MTAVAVCFEKEGERKRAKSRTFSAAISVTRSVPNAREDTVSPLAAAMNRSGAMTVT